jgi:hypothetical protein
MISNDFFHNKAPQNTGIALPQKDHFIRCTNFAIGIATLIKRKLQMKLCKTNK